MCEIEGLRKAALSLGLPLPKLVPEPALPGSSPPKQVSAPARLRKPRSGSHGSSPERGSPTKRPASSGDLARDAAAAKAAARNKRSCRRSTTGVTAQRTMRKSMQPAQDQAPALAQLYRQLQQAHLAASSRISQLQGELEHWRGHAHGLAREAQQLRHRLVLSEMQLDAAQQKLQVELYRQQAGLAQAQRLPAGLPGLCQPASPAQASFPCLPAHCEAGGLPTACISLPASCGLPAPSGPLPECGDWAEALMPELELDFLL